MESVLKEVAKRLKQYSRGNDLVSRLAGDEFVLLLQEAKSSKSELSSRITTSFLKPVERGSLVLNISISAGISFYPDDGINFDELLSKADESMYKVKNARKNI